MTRKEVHLFKSMSVPLCGRSKNLLVIVKIAVVEGTDVDQLFFNQTSLSSPNVHLSWIDAGPAKVIEIVAK